MNNKACNYYGAEHEINVENCLYDGIENIHDLYNALVKSWSRETCTQRLRHKWTKEDYTCGQCAITAFVVQDIFGKTIQHDDLETQKCSAVVYFLPHAQIFSQWKAIYLA